MARCTIQIQINTADDVRAILNLPLEYDRRKKNSHLGRRLVHDVTLRSGDLVQHLRACDRLHPSRVLRDVADFEYTPLPFVCTFWRSDPKTCRLLHASPLMHIPGVGMHTWCVDILHSWHLGSLLRLIGRIFWFLLRSDAWHVARNMPWLLTDDIMHANLLRLRSELFVWYQQKARADPAWARGASRLWNLTIKMLGKESNPVLRAKANETKNLVEFVVALLENHAANLDETVHKYLLASARAAHQVNEIIRTSPRLMTRDQQQELLNAFIRHCSMYERAGGHLVAKHHLMLHCIQRIGVLGNPKYYSCYRDESLNGVLIKISRRAHRMTFMDTVHIKFMILGYLGLCTHMY